MKAAAREWVEKAEADYTAAVLLRRSRKKGTRDIACFHLQQCLEKYLKARLVEASLGFPRTHDLEKLLDLVLPVEPQWGALRRSLTTITDYAVEVRYPGRGVTTAEARTAVRLTDRVRAALRQALGLR